ncbi:MAG: hypothetical protein ACLPYO_23340 [Mycobacterium sp.]
MITDVLNQPRRIATTIELLRPASCIGPRGEQMSGGRYTVGLMDAAEHWQAWLERYGADYNTDEERRAAYRDFKSNLARLTEMFSGQDHDH